MKKEEIKIKYPVFSLRLSKETIELLKQKQKESGKSWNRFIYQLLSIKK